MRFGSPYQQIVVRTADYTAVSGQNSNDDLVIMDATAGARTVTLPSFVGGQVDPVQGIGHIRVMKAITDISGNPLNVAVAGGGSIFGQSVIYQPGQAVDYYADALGNWYAFGPIQNYNQLQVPLSAAQIIGMNAAPVTLIAAPGAGKVIVVDNVTFKMIRTATAFTGGGAISIEYSGGTDVTATIAATVVTGGAGTVFQNVRGIEASTALSVNEAIRITNATAAFADGTGTALVILDFHVL